MRKKTKQLVYRPNMVMTVIFMGVIIVGLIMSLVFMGQRQELRKKAAGVEQTANLGIRPSVATTSPGVILPGPATLILSASDKTEPRVDGFQVRAAITGTIPVDFRFNAATLPGLRLIRNILEPSPKTGKILTLAFVTQTPTLPYALTHTDLGTFTFTAPATGTMTISMSSQQTLITKYSITENILRMPPPYTFVFATPTPTPTPTPRFCPRVKCPDGGTQRVINGRCSCPSVNPVE